jgi:hypothetical protein
MENKHTQYVDFSNPNADKIITGVTNKPMINNKQVTAVEWLEIELKKKGFDFPYVTLKIEQAKEIEKEQKIELLKWRETRFTKDAPLEYVLSEFEKLQNK